MDTVDLLESARVLIAGLSAKRDAFDAMVLQLETFVATHDLRGLTTLTAGGEPLAEAMRRPVARPRKTTPRVRETTTAVDETLAPDGETDPPADETTDGRAKPFEYDRKVLVVLRDHPYGLPLSDIARALMGRERASSQMGTIKYVLDRLVRNEQVVREGRIYKLDERATD